MANEQQSLVEILQDILPEQTAQLLRDHVLDPKTPVQIIYRQLSIRLSQAFTALRPVYEPMANRAMVWLNNSPDLVLLGAVLTALFILIQCLMLVHRMMLFWTRLMMRMVFWACAAGVLAVIWQRGPETTIRDAVVFVSKVVGYAAVVKDIWLSEYAKWDAQTKNGGGGAGGTSRASAGRVRQAGL